MTQSANPGRGSARPIGAGEHIVGQGECVISIADKTGHFWKTLWDHPTNAELKAVRGAPHVLLAGDRLHVPPIRIKEVSAPTEGRHRFRRKGIPIHFEVVVMENGVPLSGNRYVLKIEGQLTEGTIPNDGLINVPMMPQDRKGELRVDVGSTVRVYPLLFGRLDPPHTRTGATGRLQNLGYLGPAEDAAVFSASLKRFQKDQGLAASGELDDTTAAKLAQVHGS
jgi:hypothetical protein